MRRVVCSFVATCAAAWTVPAVAAGGNVSGPVAVMPFKNLSADPDLEWLTVGISETLISDIRDRGEMTVVERGQIERAIQEVAFQSEKATDVTTATKIGRIVGAKTIVVGGFQKSGSTIRITARFVAVETGVVLDAAKTTGPVEQIFSLQDQIVSRLLGGAVQSKQPKRPKRRPRPKQNKETVAAYKLFAQSLRTATHSQRIELLREALKIDPTFYYASDEISALEARMHEYEARADKARSKHEQKLHAVFADPKADTMRRQAAAAELYSVMAQKSRHRAVLQLAEEIYSTPWPEGMPISMPQMALTWMFSAYRRLKQPDRALQVGEQFLKEFPTSLFYPSISSGMKSIIDEKHRHNDDKLKVEEELEKIEEKRAEIASDRCAAHHEAKDWSGAVTVCAAFIAEQRTRKGEQVERWVREARWMHIDALYETGVFGEARRQAELLINEEPDYAERRAVAKRMRGWPRD
ncbi:MAG: hypothetical protein V3T05_01550 [Myxococcota bacterium]